jgi:hypothetical protein
VATPPLAGRAHRNHTRKGIREMTIDERLEALTQSVELMAGIQQKNEEGMKSLHVQTLQELHTLTVEVRRFRYWAEAVILNHESRLLALAKEPKQEPPQ